MQYPSAGKVYFKSFKVIETLKALTEDDAPRSFRMAALKAFNSRWKMWHTILHGAAYVLDPEFLDVDMSELTEPMQDIDKVIPLLSKNSDDAKKAAIQLQNFRDKKGTLGSEIALSAAKDMSGGKWWRRFGYESQELKYVAVRVLSQVVSATASERNWSAFGQQHTAIRGNMSWKRAKSLTYCYQSLRLRDKLADPTHSEIIPAWEELAEDDSEDGEREYLLAEEVDAASFLAIES